MRDPDRIDPIIEQLRTHWKANPDQRLTQLICNAARVGSGKNYLEDPFYIEDEEIVTGLSGAHDHQR